MKKDFTGWVEHDGIDIYLENGRVKRGTCKENGSVIAIYLYRRMTPFHTYGNQWIQVEDISFNYYKRAIKTDKYKWN